MGDRNAPGFLQIIDTIYSGIDDSAQWDVAARQFVELAGGHCGLIGIVDEHSPDTHYAQVLGPETSRIGDAIDLYQSELLLADPGIAHLAMNPDGGRFVFSQEKHGASEDWVELIEGGLGASDYEARFNSAENGIRLILTLHVKDAPQLTARQADIHRLVFAHFERAARLRLRPPAMAETGAGQALVDLHGAILSINRAAIHAIEAEPGIFLKDSRISLGSLSRTAEFLRKVHEVCFPARSGTSQNYMRPGRSSGMLLRLTPVPIAGVYGVTRCNCLVEIIERPRKLPGIAPALLCDVFGLTRREAELASRFSGPDNNLRSAAEATGMGYETARFHMRTILDKCGTANQVELAQLLAQFR